MMAHHRKNASYQYINTYAGHVHIYTLYICSIVLLCANVNAQFIALRMLWNYYTIDNTRETHR